MIALSDIGTNAGMLTHLTIAQRENPGFADNAPAAGVISSRLMQATVANRLANDPAQFGAATLTTFADNILVALLNNAWRLVRACGEISRQSISAD